MSEIFMHARVCGMYAQFAREKRATLNEVITDYRDGMLHQQQQKDE